MNFSQNELQSKCTSAKMHFSQNSLQPKIRDCFIFIYTPSNETLTTPINIEPFTVDICGLGSSAGIAPDYGLDGPGSNPGGGRDFPAVQTGPGAHPAFYKMGTGSFPGVKCGRGVLLTTHPRLVPRSRKSRAIPLPTLWATPGL